MWQTNCSSNIFSLLALSHSMMSLYDIIIESVNKLTRFYIKEKQYKLMNNTTSYYVHLSGKLHMLCLEIWNKMYVVATCLLCTGCFTKFGILVLYSLVFLDTIFSIHPIQIDHVANAYKPFIQNSLSQHVVY